MPDNTITPKTHISVPLKTMWIIIITVATVVAYVIGISSEFNYRIDVNADHIEEYQINKIPVLINEVDNLGEDVQEVRDDIKIIKNFLIPNK